MGGVIIPPPPGPPGPGFGLPRAPRVVDPLDRSIGDVCRTGMPGVLPLRSYAPARGNISDGETLLKRLGAPTLPALSDRMAERLLLALASMTNANLVAVRALTDRTTIRAFRTLGEGQQLAFINRLWNVICSAHDFNTRGNQMSDPAADGMTGATLPSSVFPTARGVNIFQKRLNGRQPFREFGIGFRVDGGDQGSIDRVLGNGMTQ